MKQRILRKLISGIIHDTELHFTTPQELKEKYGPVAEIDANEPSCWVENFHPSYYPGNNLQKDSIHQLFNLEKSVHLTSNSGLKLDWKYLQTSNHFHLMDENHSSYNSYAKTGSIYKSKYDAYINYMNILEDFGQRLKAENKKDKLNKSSADNSVANKIPKSDH
jgi:alpha-amylase